MRRDGFMTFYPGLTSSHSSALKAPHGKSRLSSSLEEIRISNGVIFPTPIGLTIVKTDHLIVGKEILLRLAKRAIACNVKLSSCHHPRSRGVQTERLDYVRRC